MFEKLYYILARHFTSIDSLTTALNAVQDLILIEREDAAKQWKTICDEQRADHNKQVHELLVALALSNENVWQPASVQKITAIKALRNLVGFPHTSLKQAKEAVEDSRVFAKSQEYHNGWIADVPHTTVTRDFPQDCEQ